MTFEIESIKYRLGEKSVSVQEICELTGKNYARLIQRSGIEIVHRTAESEYLFFGKFLDQELRVQHGDWVIFVNQSIAGLIPGKISALFVNQPEARNVSFIEISDGCTGFARALIMGNSILESKLASRIHIVCAEKYSRFYDDQDESVSPIFSDAISATTLTSNGRIRIAGSKVVNFFADSAAISINLDSEGKEKIGMEGARVLSWATREIPKVVFELLEEGELTIDQIGSWYVHQGSKIVVESIMDTLGVNPEDKFTSCQIGNTVSSTIPIMLKDGYSTLGARYISKGYAMLLGFGVGLSIVAILLEVIE